MPVDVQVLNNAPLTFKYHVYAESMLLLVKDRTPHDVEYTGTILEYMDFDTLKGIAIQAGIASSLRL